MRSIVFHSPPTHFTFTFIYSDWWTVCTPTTAASTTTSSCSVPSRENTPIPYVLAYVILLSFVLQFWDVCPFFLCQHPRFQHNNFALSVIFLSNNAERTSPSIAYVGGHTQERNRSVLQNLARLVLLQLTAILTQLVVFYYKFIDRN